MANRLIHISDTTQYELDGKVLISDISYMNLENERDLFTYDVEIKNNPIVGIGEVGISAYTEWFNTFSTYNILCLTLIGGHGSGYGKELGFRNICVGKPDALVEVFMMDGIYKFYNPDIFDDRNHRLSYFDNLCDIDNEDMVDVTFRLMRIDA